MWTKLEDNTVQYAEVSCTQISGQNCQSKLRKNTWLSEIATEPLALENYEGQVGRDEVDWQVESMDDGFSC